MGERLTRHWQNDPKPRPRKRGFEVQEERALKAIGGGNATRGSGSSNRASQKGDGFNDHIRVSCKTTEKAGAKSIRVERDWLDEITAQARATGHRPALTFGFSPDAMHPLREDWLGFPVSVAEPMVRSVLATLRGDHEAALEYAELAMGGSA